MRVQHSTGGDGFDGSKSLMLHYGNDNTGSTSLQMVSAVEFHQTLGHARLPRLQGLHRPRENLPPVVPSLRVAGMIETT